MFNKNTQRVIVAIIAIILVVMMVLTLVAPAVAGR
jgi:flagellin-like protein